MSVLQMPGTNPQVDYILSEISKLSLEDREIIRISLAAAYWQDHLPELVLEPATEDELSLEEIDNIKHQSR